MILATRSSVTVEKVESTGGGESGAMCCDLWETGKVFFQFFLRRTPQICRPGAEGDLSMVASWLGVCATHRQGPATTPSGHDGHPESLL